HNMGRFLADQYVEQYGNYTQYQVNNVLTFTFEGVEEVEELQDFTINFVKADGTLIQSVDYENMTQEEIVEMGRFLADQYVEQYGIYSQGQVENVLTFYFEGVEEAEELQDFTINFIKA